MNSPKFGEWQTMESAPKNGTPILYTGVYKRNGVLTTRICSWDKIKKKWVDMSFRMMVKEPTHWMPLPELPDFYLKD
jgi:hypothetical protein